MGFKFPDISRFSRQVVTLNITLLISAQLSLEIYLFVRWQTTFEGMKKSRP